jgi:glucose/arabinose dehydrogenase
MRHLLPALVAVVLATGAPATADVIARRFAFDLESPTFLTSPPNDFGRVFVTELGGDIEILDRVTGAWIGTFLTLPSTSGEGFQGLAFHPDYDSNGYFFVYYTNGTSTFVDRYTVSGDPNVADAGSRLQIIEIPQPAPDHQGGWIGFGPDDYLWIPLGDGGGSNDPNGYGQNIVGELLGSLLRIDVDGDDFPADPDKNYAIPSDNPFVGITGEDEIWSYGLRNPYRASFDRVTGDLYLGDVGQAAREEVDIVPAASTGGENFGWSLREGTIETPAAGVGGPPPPDNVEPIYDYPHGTATNEGRSVTGGIVYRGTATEIRGKYFFGDWANQRIWSIEHDGTSVTEFIDWTDQLAPFYGEINGVVAFGEDGFGDMYIVDLDGEIFKVEFQLPRIPGAPALSAPMLGALTLALAALGAGALTRRRA